MQTMVCNLNCLALAVHQLTTADKPKQNETKTLLFDATATAVRMSLLKEKWDWARTFFSAVFAAADAILFSVRCIAHFPFPSVQLHLYVPPKMH